MHGFRKKRHSNWQNYDKANATFTTLPPCKLKELKEQRSHLEDVMYLRIQEKRAKRVRERNVHVRFFSDCDDIIPTRLTAHNISGNTNLQWSVGHSHRTPVAKARLHFVAALYIVRHSFLNTQWKKRKKKKNHTFHHGHHSESQL